MLEFLIKTVFAQFIMLGLGAALLALSWGMWAARRKYPQPDLPTDGTEGAIAGGLALVGFLFLAIGGLL